MNFKKIFLVLIIPFFLTGCASVNYNLNINIFHIYMTKKAILYCTKKILVIS